MKNRIAILDLRSNTRVRLIIKSDNDYRLLMWMKLAADGSIYFGPSYKKITQSSHLRKHTGGRRTTFRSEDLTTDVKPYESKISFHASGVIHMSGKRYFRDSIRELIEQEEICTFFFEKLYAYPLWFKKDRRTTDIRILDAYNPGIPIQAKVFIAPKGKERKVEIADSQYQANLMIYYGGDNGLNERCLQLVLYQATNQDWPDATYILMPSGKRILSARIRRFIKRLTSMNTLGVEPLIPQIFADYAEDTYNVKFICSV